MKKKAVEPQYSSDEDQDPPEEDPDDDEDEDPYQGDDPIPVGGQAALKILERGGDAIRSHPPWVHLPPPDLEAQRSEIRNHISVC